MFRSVAAAVRRLSGVARTADGSTLVALHPAAPVPWSRTSPLPEQPLEEDGSPLRMPVDQARRVFRSSLTPEQSRRELQRLTHTTKHRWFARSRDKKAKKTEPDRPYL